MRISDFSGALERIKKLNYCYAQAIRANPRYTNTAKLPTKLIPKNHPLSEYWNEKYEKRLAYLYYGKSYRIPQNNP